MATAALTFPPAKSWAARVAIADATCELATRTLPFVTAQALRGED
jgi:hypothetical protein